MDFGKKEPAISYQKDRLAMANELKSYCKNQKIGFIPRDKFKFKDVIFSFHEPHQLDSSEIFFSADSRKLDLS